MKSSKIKLEALRLAVKLHGPDPITPEVAGMVLATANVFAEWLGSSVLRLTIVADRTTYSQNGTAIPVFTKFIGDKVELKDNQQVPLTLHAKDAKGFDTAEDAGVTLTWSSSDDTVVSLQPASDGLSCEAVAGNPGSAMVTVSDGTRSGSLAIDVTTGTVSAITVEAGTPEDQPAAP